MRFKEIWNTFYDGICDFSGAFKIAWFVPFQFWSFSQFIRIISKTTFNRHSNKSACVIMIDGILRAHTHVLLRAFLTITMTIDNQIFLFSKVIKHCKTHIIYEFLAHITLHTHSKHTFPLIPLVDSIERPTSCWNCQTFDTCPKWFIDVFLRKFL